MTTYKFKLYNDEDTKYLNEVLNIAGGIYNHCIALHRFYYRAYGKYLNKYQLQKHLTKCKNRGLSHRKKVNAQATQNITDRIDEAYKRFFDALKKESKRRVSPPSFQKSKRYKSITYKQDGYKLLEGNVIKIQGRNYRYHKSREIEGKIKTMTLKRTPLGEFFITVVTDHVATGETENRDRTAVGIDFGLKTFLNLSTGEKIESPLFLKQSMKELKKAGRKHSTKKKGSNNRHKAKMHLVRVHENISNQRKDWFWKTAKELCERFDVIVFEDLNLKGMQMMWGRKVSDLGFAEFLNILEVQAKKHNTNIVYIDRFFPSSKMCSSCGTINSGLEVSDREWTCSCGETHDRDLNASRNILHEGLRLLTG